MLLNPLCKTNNIGYNKAFICLSHRHSLKLSLYNKWKAPSLHWQPAAGVNLPGEQRAALLNCKCLLAYLVNMNLSLFFTWIFCDSIDRFFPKIIGLNYMNIITCFDSCSSHSLYSVKNFLARTTLAMKPQLANLTRIMIWRSGTIIATERKLIFKFSGSSCRPAYPGFWRGKTGVEVECTLHKQKYQWRSGPTW